MHVQVGAHAVARAVSVVQAFLPEPVACRGVELGAARAVRETAAAQCDVPFEYEGVGAALLVGERAEGHGARDVCGAVVVLRPGVEQEQAAGTQLRVGVGRGFVVHDGAVGGVSGYRLEAQAAIVGRGGAQFGQFEVNAHFGHAACRHSLVQPVQQADHGHAVALHRTAHPGDLGVVFHGFQRGDRRGGKADAFAFQGCGEDAAVRCVGQEQRGAAQSGEVGFEGVVRAQSDALSVEVGGHFRCHLLRVDIECRRVGADEQVADEHRVARHVVAAQVQRPRHLVEGRHEQV
ncbi:oRF1 [Prevotella sp. CAG:755]|nr:oRF1 [Prevotella sp. CAG:755]